MRSNRTPLLVAAATLMAALLAAPRAPAQGAQVAPETKSAARRLATEGQKLFDAGDYESALGKFDRADTLVPATTLGLRAARCLVKLGRLVEASERYLQVSRMPLDASAPDVMRKAQEDARAERAALLPQVPNLTIELEGPTGSEVAVLVDGKPIPAALLGEQRPTDPGTHKVEVKRPDTTVSGEVTLAPGEAGRLRLQLPPLPPPPELPEPPLAPTTAAPRPSTAPLPPPWQPPPPPLAPEPPPYRTAGIVGVSVGGAGLAIGIISGSMAITQADALRHRCGDPNPALTVYQCPNNSSNQSSIGSYNVAKALTIAGLAAGGIGLAVGIPLLVIHPRADQKGHRARVTPWVTFGGAGVRGIF